MIVNVGMWLERFVIVVISLHRDFLPSSWGMYTPTIWDWSTFVGTIGLFLALMFLFIRVLPMISIFEMRAILPEAKAADGGGTMTAHALYGLMAEFESPAALVEAARHAREAGYTKIDAYTPYPDRGAARGARTSTTAGCRPSSWSAASWAALAGYSLCILDVGRLVSRSTSAASPSTAGPPSSPILRDDDSRRRLRGGLRDARPERAAACRITRVFNVPRFAMASPRPLLSLHRVARSASSTTTRRGDS